MSCENAVMEQVLLNPTKTCCPWGKPYQALQEGKIKNPEGGMSLRELYFSCFHLN